nr:MAG TPA: hypothetical protein [Caudoviricetes sp.]
MVREIHSILMNLYILQTHYCLNYTIEIVQVTHMQITMYIN